MTEDTPLGVIAGGGGLPRAVLGAAELAGRATFTLALTGSCDEATVEGRAHAWLPVTKVGAVLAALRGAGCRDVVLCGRVAKPNFDALLPDATGLRLLPRLRTAARSGDDALLRVLVAFMEEEGFRVVGADSVTGTLLAATGVLGAVQPPADMRRDIGLAMAAARAHGISDVGQGAVVRNGEVIAREEYDGTDAMLARVAGLPGRAGVLAKATKPHQERRVDLPTVGVQTVENAAAAGLSGIAFEAGGTLLPERADTIAAADRLGLFLVGVDLRTVCPRVMVVAGEASGDLHGAALLRGLRSLAPGADLFGIGGERMVQEGMQSLFPQQDLAVMGLLEVLPRVRRIARRMKETVALARDRRPDAVVTIDSPGFNFRLAERLHGLNVPLIHLVAPQVWAWKPERAERTANLFDKLLCILPFEPPLFPAKLQAEFVGHPVLESGADGGDAGRFRAARGIGPERPILLVLPGSRSGEVRRLLPVFRDAVAHLRRDHPGLVVVIPTIRALRDDIVHAVEGWPGEVVVVTGNARYDAFAAAGAAIAASGTVALELAMAKVPHVVAYRLNAVTAAIARRLLRVKYVNLLNLLLDRAAVPELLQDNCTPAKIAAAVAPLLVDEAARTAQIRAAEGALVKLYAGETPGRRAAEAVMAAIAGWKGRKT